MKAARAALSAREEYFEPFHSNPCEVLRVHHLWVSLYKGVLFSGINVNETILFWYSLPPWVYLWSDKVLPKQNGTVLFFFEPERAKGREKS